MFTFPLKSITKVNPLWFWEIDSSNDILIMLSLDIYWYNNIEK